MARSPPPPSRSEKRHAETDIVANALIEGETQARDAKIARLKALREKRDGTGEEPKPSVQHAPVKRQRIRRATTQGRR